MIKEELGEMGPSAEEKKELEEEVQKDEEEEEEKDDESSDEEEEEDGDEEQEVREDKTTLPVNAKKKKTPEGLNLNNEVVRMRKEVKRVRALIIRKLTRQIGALNKKKGKMTEIERNQRRAARLLKEIHAIKALSPDLVTKTALQKNLNFEDECKNPKSTISDRAIARIGTHPQFKKKIDDIKAAVKAFKDERMRGGKIVMTEKVEKKTVNVIPHSPDKKTELTIRKEEDVTGEEKEIMEREGEDGILKDATEPAISGSETETSKGTHSPETADVEKEELPESLNVKPAATRSSQVEENVKDEPQIKISNKKPDQKSTPEMLQKNKEEDESDLEPLDDEEKEYFDDSTEERFHKQSSQSEESDSEDDFFIGKVSKFKNKKPKSVEGEKKDKGKKDPTEEAQSKCNELESRLKSKATSLQSVFCSSLSVLKPGGGMGAGRGRSGDRFRGQGKPKGNSGLNKDFRKQSKFQTLEKGTESNSLSMYSKPESSERGFPSAGRGRGRGRGAGMMQKDHRGGGVFSQQALHPSWEASKKRKEQQGQILAFQGKKIKFDDDN